MNLGTILTSKKLYARTFSNVSWQMQLIHFQVQTSHQLIKIQVIFHSNINHTQNKRQNKIYYAHQARNTTWYRIRKDKEVDRNLTFQERAHNVSSLLLEQYNGSIQPHYNITVSRKVLSDKGRPFCSFWNKHRLQLFLKFTFSSEMYSDFLYDNCYLIILSCNLITKTWKIWSTQLQALMRYINLH